MSYDKFTDTIRQNHEQAIEEVTRGRQFDAWIKGSSRTSIRGERFETKDPATEKTITTVPRCQEEDVDKAVEAAKKAFNQTWGSLPVDERSEALLDWVETLRANSEELALLESLDTGKPLADAEYEVSEAINYIEYYAQIARGEQGDQLPIGDDTHAFTKHEPYGVAGLIVPWNYPLLLASWKLGPALSAGNTVVLKPAEDSPLSVTRIAQLSEDVLPPGTLNIVHGFGDEAGAPLTRHEDISKLSFTGEGQTGETIMKAAAEQITPVTLELGGKSPFIVFPDADLENAAEIAAEGIFYNTGQSCDAFSRTLVHEDIHAEFLELFRAEAEERIVGDPLAKETTTGPLASKQQFEKVREYIEIGKKEGAALVHGGESISITDSDDGWFVEPTIFDGVENDMRIAQEEIFGPVASVIQFADYNEAVSIANDIDFGLAAGVATTDLSIAHRASDDIQAGTVWVNQYADLVPGTPFGGFKRSGIGRECAKDTLREYQQTKTVNISLGQMD
ncbi:Aldehyde dehydrogenase (NAD(+)) (plasmid) [Haloterrigena turkmenica DSM 5511]|uniref:Aldehyde dehydrogenase (NAD(+)) n=1 Tax=Haloterrigena turkmenica (strain ATCC 51198 / DSM 5511 / JCM 9101 / NCIMB 13204 / VKM B-1734 / 4k) TaxID=543526 RepID=D2S0K3_HALTV|nr:aldehyde dehydrogenase family protein [Haloterrigena turkmenica]ADB62900.1 Aldehyde dehydrogenase (NAD(+)) [Haloterrigena turkmenica DSM 5511]